MKNTKNALTPKNKRSADKQERMKIEVLKRCKSIEVRYRICHFAILHLNFFGSSSLRVWQKLKHTTEKKARS